MTKMSVEYWWNHTDRENLSTRRKSCPIATSCITNHTRTSHGLNLAVSSERLAVTA